jgi:hypothetical protein
MLIIKNNIKYPAYVIAVPQSQGLLINSTLSSGSKEIERNGTLDNLIHYS